MWCIHRVRIGLNLSVRLVYCMVDSIGPMGAKDGGEVLGRAVSVASGPEWTRFRRLDVPMGRCGSALEDVSSKAPGDSSMERSLWPMGSLESEAP